SCAREKDRVGKRSNPLPEHRGRNLSPLEAAQELEGRPGLSSKQIRDVPAAAKDEEVGRVDHSEKGLDVGVIARMNPAPPQRQAVTDGGKMIPESRIVSREAAGHGAGYPGA